MLLRSIAFNIVFFPTFCMLLIFLLILNIVYKKFIPDYTVLISKVLGCVIRLFADITYTVGGGENISNTQTIYAIRHESAWETFMIGYFVRFPIFILKKDLVYLPILGSVLKIICAISIDRNAAVKSLKRAINILKGLSDNEKRSIVIFPEGTRAPSGEHIEIKRGVALLYKSINCQVVPVVHNAGKFWPRRGFFKKPGNIEINFLNPIPAGLSTDDFMEKLSLSFYNEVERLRTKEGDR